MKNQRVWIEITKSEHRHGGPGWEFGTCLWSPSKNRAGVDRYRIMRSVEPGDKVIHFYHTTWPDGITETRIAGLSEVKKVIKKLMYNHRLLAHGRVWFHITESN